MSACAYQSGAFCWRSVIGRVCLALVLCCPTPGSLWSDPAAGVPQSQVGPGEESVKQLLESLPPDSQWRGPLAQGARGDGIHQPWMDDMRTAGVKLAIATIEFAWARKGRQLNDWTPSRIQYFRDYDRFDPIVDPHELAQITAGKLGPELTDVALARAKRAYWFEYPRERRGLGFRDILLAGNEWLPVALGPDWLIGYQPDLTPLMRAALHGDVVLIHRLVREGAKVNSVARSGMTPLMWAADSNSPAAVNALLRAGADVNANPKGHGNVLAGAVAEGHVRIVRMLLEAGADPNSRDADGQSVLLIATRFKYAEIARVLKEAGARE